MPSHTSFQFRKFFPLVPLVALICGVFIAQAWAASSYSAAGIAPQTRTRMQNIVLAGGCFWGTQAVFQHLKGVKAVVSGYTGGEANTARYEAVVTGMTGHAESVRVTYDPSQISLEQILKVYFLVAHHPTEFDYQGPDIGTQYRSAVFTTTSEQRKTVDAYIAQLRQVRAFASPIVTEVATLKAFYPAEDYHQNYVQRHPDKPYVRVYDSPKVSALQKKFPELYVEP